MLKHLALLVPIVALDCAGGIGQCNEDDDDTSNTPADTTPDDTTPDDDDPVDTTPDPDPVPDDDDDDDDGDDDCGILGCGDGGGSSGRDGWDTVIEPEDPDENDNLHCNVKARDGSSSRPAGLIYTWEVDGTELPGAVSAFLSANETQAGDRVRCEAEGDDFRDSDSVSIGAIVPEFDVSFLRDNADPCTATIQAVVEFDDEDLQDTYDNAATPADVEALALEFDIEWFADGDDYPRDFDTAGPLETTRFEDDTVPIGDAEFGRVWKVKIEVENDREDFEVTRSFAFSEAPWLADCHP